MNTSVSKTFHRNLFFIAYLISRVAILIASNGYVSITLKSCCKSFNSQKQISSLDYRISGLNYLILCILSCNWIRKFKNWQFKTNVSYSLNSRKKVLFRFKNFTAEIFWELLRKKKLTCQKQNSLNVTKSKVSKTSNDWRKEKSKKKRIFPDIFKVIFIFC